ncbi:putative B3 domain-containing protein Os04g0347400 isoform X2 [Salvia miltiorrhiza]|uniref:putative B3 domain-containing protein Os04g0347400 isoform X2 n=1 Tax=Salvia miltiorrhiza TaxID=226208 RepID=UPI0025AC1EC8|nr:putative B3 domain-containing protein Os04g0347400 isoform X2 [Salvia miltiorrhiza]
MYYTFGQYPHAKPIFNHFSSVEMAKDEVAATSKIVLSAGFKKKMMLPSVYYKKIKQEKSEWAILKTPKGKWRVKVCRDDDGDIFFKNGWSEFADENAFNNHDSLVLEHTCNLMCFNVNVNVADVAAVSTPPQNRGSSQAKSCKGKEKKKDVVSPHTHTHSQWPQFFRKRMTDYCGTKGAMHIPLELARSNNLTSKESVSLMDPGGKEWAFKLQIQNDLLTGKLRRLLISGWHKFYVANHLKSGDVCEFTLNPASSSTSTTAFFHVHITRLDESTTSST